ncbi:hypothetical protein [Campylobacter jejuni]|uniref:hypothetical protein n=1 Tax=Campylobacter jejuni TaxID=197 RepID=UPI0001C27607|nr:hypothetical protein [Campylobacter jejuni]EFC30259.1 hypothetical protein C1336_000330024 [Campylobacter jejuni subsp. jejuni 1336]
MGSFIKLCNATTGFTGSNFTSPFSHISSKLGKSGFFLHKDILANLFAFFLR